MRIPFAEILQPSPVFHKVGSCAVLRRSHHEVTPACPRCHGSRPALTGTRRLRLCVCPAATTLSSDLAPVVCKDTISRMDAPHPKKPPRPDRQPTHFDPSNPGDRALEVAGALAQVIPVVGGVLNSIMSGRLVQGRIDRIAEEMIKLKEEVEQVKDKIHADYVGTDEFEELLAQTLDKMGRELDPEKRSQYRRLILNLMVLPPEDYGEQRRLLRLAEKLTPKHIELLRAYMAEPGGRVPDTASPVAILAGRIGRSAEDVKSFAADLADARLINETNNLATMMNGHAAVDQRRCVTPSGRRLLDLLAK